MTGMALTAMSEYSEPTTTSEQASGGSGDNGSDQSTSTGDHNNSVADASSRAERGDLSQGPSGSDRPDLDAAQSPANADSANEQDNASTASGASADNSPADDIGAPGPDHPGNREPTTTSEQTSGSVDRGSDRSTDAGNHSGNVTDASSRSERGDLPSNTATSEPNGNDRPNVGAAQNLADGRGDEGTNSQHVSESRTEQQRDASLDGYKADGTKPTTTTSPDGQGGTYVTTTTPHDGGLTDTHSVHEDAAGTPIGVKDQVQSRDADGNTVTDRTISSVDPQTRVQAHQQIHTVDYKNDSADGKHEAGSTQTTTSGVTVDSQGNVEETRSVSGQDQKGNTSTTEETTDQTTGETTITTTTADKNGDGTVHTEIIDSNSNTIFDYTAPIP